MSRHGIPEKSTFLQLLYNETAQCVIASVAREDDSLGYVAELYYRHNAAVDYTRVLGPSTTAELHQPVSCSDSARVYFLALVRAATMGLNCESVSFVDLRTGQVEVAVACDALSVPSGYSAVWPSRLVAVLPKGGGIIGSFGFERPTGQFDSVVDYWLCELRIPELHLIKLTALPDVFT